MLVSVIASYVAFARVMFYITFRSQGRFYQQQQLLRTKILKFIRKSYTHVCFEVGNLATEIFRKVYFVMQITILKLECLSYHCSEYNKTNPLFV